MPPPPEPATVWAVRVGVSNEDSKGVLSLEEDHLVFIIEEGTLRIPLADIRRVRRVRGSPVMTVDRAEAAGRVRLAFFFIKPPTLQPQGQKRRRRHQRESLFYLQSMNRDVKPVIGEWVRAVKDAAAEAASRQAD